MGNVLVLTPGFMAIVRKSPAETDETEGAEERSTKAEGEHRHHHHEEVTVTDFRVKDGKARFNLHL